MQKLSNNLNNFFDKIVEPKTPEQEAKEADQRRADADRKFAERNLIKLAGLKLQQQGYSPDEYVGLSVNDAYDVLGISESL